MQYGKLIDGTLVLAPRSIRVGDRQIGNPPAEILIAEGYLPVIYAEPPDTEPGYIAVDGWYDEGDALRQTWTIVEEPDEISEERAYRIITGEEE